LTWILILRALAGAAAATWVDFTILFTSYYRKEETTRAIGTISVYNNLGQMLGILCGGWFADRFGWDASFQIGAVVGFAGLVLAFFLVEKFDPDAQKITARGVIEVAGDKTLLTVSFLSIVFQILSFATVFGFTPVYAQSLGAGKFDMGLLTFVSTLPTAVAAWIGGRHLANRIGEKNIVIFGFILCGVFTVVIPFSQHLWFLMVTQALAGFGRGFVSPVLMSLAIKGMDVGKRATAMGFYQAIYGLGMFAGPWFMGMAGDWISLNMGFVIVGSLGCITSLLSWIMIRLEKPAAGTNGNPNPNPTVVTKTMS
jgi:MFS family permease